MLVNIPYMEHMGMESLSLKSVISNFVNGHFRILNWSYLPYIRPMQGLCKGIGQSNLTMISVNKNELLHDVNGIVIHLRIHNVKYP